MSNFGIILSVKMPVCLANNVLNFNTASTRGEDGDCQ